MPFDRTTGVYGPQGCGKTLDVLTPALLSAPGAALVTLTKPEDLLLTLTRRSRQGRPVAVLDPFGLAPGLPQLVWDPIGGCVDSMIAERRAKAFAAGTVAGAASSSGDNAARFYAAEAAKVLQGYFHAAALTGRSIADVLDWVANPRQASLPEEVLRTHPHAAPFWHGLLHAALHGDERTAGNTITTIQQALALFFQQSLRDRCVPGPGRAPVDVAELITRGGTVYLLGRDDPYASASPLMTAVAEDVLDTALQLAHASPHGRLCPSFLACLDELPSTAPLPTLRTRMANERALGLSFIYAAQTWRQLVICYGQDEARALFGLTNIITLFGGGKDGAFNREMSELIGTTRVTRTTYTHGTGRHEHRHLPHRRRRADPAPRGDPAAARTARPHRGGERQTVDRAPDPRHRRQTRPGPASRSRGRQSQSRRRPRPPHPPGCAHPGRRRRGHPPRSRRTVQRDSAAAG